MPGLKRKASQPAPTESPPKLKKQSTSAAVDKGKPTAVPKKGIPTTPPRLKKGKSEKPVKEKTPKKSPGKLHKLPRFPTLKPTGPISSDGPDFTFTVPSFYKKSISKPNMKKAHTLIIQESTSVKKEKSVKKSQSNAPTLELAPQATVILQPEIEVEPGATRATAIEKKIQMLPSGSVFGKITNADFDDMTLPTDASLAIYEFSEESSSTSFGATPGKMTGSSPQSRASANLVADFFSTSDGTKDFGFSDDEFMSNEETSNQTESKASNGVLTPMKSPRKLTGGPREIVFSFDTTGSMYNYVEEVAEKIKELVPKLQSEIPGIRLAFIAHGDYYDLKQDRYLIKWLDFGASVEETVKFFENLNITHGGDADECYELALRKARESLDWTSGSQRCLVMIGDSDPHEPGYKFDEFVNDIDWRVEAALLRDMGVRIYGMQVGYRSDFYRQISQITGGAHLRIDNASFTPDMLMAICLREGSLKLLKSYENEVRKAKKEAGEVGLLDLELERLFSSLKSVDDNKSSKVKMKMKLLSEKEDQKNEEPPTLTPAPVKRPSESKSETKSGEPLPKKAKKQKFEALTPKIIKERKKAEKAAKKAEKSSKKSFTKIKPAKQEKTNKTIDKKTSSEKKTKVKAEQQKVQKTKGKSKKDETKKTVVKKKEPKATVLKKTTSMKSKVNKVSTKQSQAKKILKKTISKSVKQPKKSKEPLKKPKTKTPVKKSLVKKGTPKKTTKTSDVKKKVLSKKTGVKQTSKTLTSKKKNVEKVPKKKNVEKVPKQKGKPQAKDVKAKDAQKKTTKAVDKKKSVVTKDKRTTIKGKITKINKKTSEMKVSSKKAEAIKKVFKASSQLKESAAKKKSPPTKSSGKKDLADFKLPKSPSKPVNKQPRENASVIKFTMSPLNSMFWDDWKSFIVQEKPIIKSKEWKKCPSWCPGYYNTTLYTDSDQVTGVFEIGVTPPNSKKHYGVYFNIKNLWDSFDSQHVKREVDRVIKKNGSISIRRGVPKKPNDSAFHRVVEYLVENFDYAWQGRSGEVVKDGFCISKS